MEMWTIEALAAAKTRIDQRVLELTPWDRRTHENHTYPSAPQPRPNFSLTMIQEVIDDYMKRPRNDKPR